MDSDKGPLLETVNSALLFQVVKQPISLCTFDYNIISLIINLNFVGELVYIFSYYYSRINIYNGQFQCLAKFLLKHEKQNPSPQLKRAYQK